MRIETTPNLPPPIKVPTPANDEPNLSPAENDKAKRDDEFQAAPRSSWSSFLNGARQVIHPKVKQAKAEGGGGGGPNAGNPLPDVVFHCADKLPKDEKHAPIRALYKEADEAAKAGDYTKAADKLDRALSRYEEEIGEAPSMKDGGIEGTRNLAAQYRVMADMKARGVTPSSPPTKDEMKAYMKSFDDKANRPAAKDAFEAYTRAFYVHPANVGRPDEDINYSPDAMKYAFDGKLYDKNEDAEKAQAKAKGGLITDIQTADASAWEDVTTNRELSKVGGPHAHAAGKRVIDCEGYAYLASELLGSAGYKFEQVAVRSKDGDEHAMAVLTDPARKGEYTVVSNDGIHTAAKKKDALDAGFKAAMPDGAETGGYYYGRTQHEAQVKMVFANI